MRTRFSGIHDLLDRFERSSGPERVAMEKLLRRVIDDNGGIPIIRHGDIFMASPKGGVAHLVGNEPRMIELPDDMRAANYVAYGSGLYSDSW
jgi:hypothetical protein